MHYAFQTPQKLYIVLEFVQGGELFTHLYNSEHFNESQVRFYIAELILALEELHKVSWGMFHYLAFCLISQCFSEKSFIVISN